MQPELLVYGGRGFAGLEHGVGKRASQSDQSLFAGMIRCPDSGRRQVTRVPTRSNGMTLPTNTNRGIRTKAQVDVAMPRWTGLGCGAAPRYPSYLPRWRSGLVEEGRHHLPYLDRKALGAAR